MEESLLGLVSENNLADNRICQPEKIADFFFCQPNAYISCAFTLTSADEET